MPNDGSLVAPVNRGLKFAVKLPFGDGTMVSVPDGPLEALLPPPQAESTSVKSIAPVRTTAVKRLRRDTIEEPPPMDRLIGH
jgi:hypothetical protein